MSRPRKVHSIVQKKASKQQNNYNNQISEILYTDAQISLQQKQCRICLQGQSFTNRLITPCRCTGSVKYIHEQCLKQWIEKSRQKKMDPIKCQLCKQQIIYTLVQQRQCNSWQTIKMKIQLNYKIFLFLFFLFLINCGVTIYLVVIFAHIIQLSAGDPKFIEIGVISFSIILLLVISSVLCGIIVREKIGQIICLPKSEKKNFPNISQQKLNNSKAQIIPLTIVQIQQIS